MNPKNNFLTWLLFLLVAFIWGSSFILMKKGLVAFTPLQVASLRIFIASIIFIPLVIFHFRQLKIKNWYYIVIIGLIGTGIPPFLFTKAQTVINSATTGILNSLTPLFALIIGIFFFRIKTDIYKVSGVLLGMFGVCVLIFLRSNGNISISIYGLLVVIATIFYATSSTMVKVFFQQMKPLHLTSFIFLFIGPPAGIYLLFSDLPSSFQNEGAGMAFSYIVILAVINTALATFLFNKLIQTSSALFAQSVTYLIPAVAIFWGILDSEKLDMFDILGIVLILMGVVLINKK